MSRLVAFKPIFASPFGYANFGTENVELNKQLINDIDLERSIGEGKDRTFKYNESSWQSGVQLEKKYESFKTLKEQIQYAIIPIMKHSGIEDRYVDYCVVEHLWANLIFKPGGFAAPHFHGSGKTLWSGVYYPHGLKENDDLDEFKEEKWIQLGHSKGDGLLIISDPAKVVKGQVKTSFETGEYYGQEVTVVPRESLLVLFPNWMTHMVTPLTTDEKRYSISFACNYGSYGDVPPDW